MRLTIVVERLVRVRALVPQQLQLCHQILGQQEALEAGQRELTAWLDSADAFLGTLSLTGGRESVQANLDRHKVQTPTLVYVY